MLERVARFGCDTAAVVASHITIYLNVQQTHSAGNKINIMINFLIDMNLSPAWVKILVAAGHSAIHWSSIGLAAAPDVELFDWARKNVYVVFTHDLDFGAILTTLTFSTFNEKLQGGHYEHRPT